VRAALDSIYTYNFRWDFRDHVNCQPIYVLNDEAGLLLCSWPRGGRPHFPLVYSDEVWPGIKYQVAAHRIYEGRVEQGLTLAGAVRVRHDGVRRNPWDAVECGHHYARSMVSWALLLALNGFGCDVAAGSLTFAPAEPGPKFRCLFSVGTGRGRYRQGQGPGTLTVEVTLDYGWLALRQLCVPVPPGAGLRVVSLNGAAGPADVLLVSGIRFEPPLRLTVGDSLRVDFGPV
jgi:non-lysosomal glucosylceramidase